MKWVPDNTPKEVRECGSHLWAVLSPLSGRRLGHPGGGVLSPRPRTLKLPLSADCSQDTIGGVIVQPRILGQGLLDYPLSRRVSVLPLLFRRELIGILLRYLHRGPRVIRDKGPDRPAAG